MTRLIRAELLKLTSTRILLWLSLLILALVALIVSLNAAQGSAQELAHAGRQRDLVSSAAVSVLVALILGIVTSAGEYAHGTISHTFLVAPTRVRVVAAKVVAAITAGVALAVVADVAALALAALWIAGKSAPAHLGSHDIRFLHLGTLLGAALASAIGVGFGALLRRQSGAIVLALVWLLVGEPLLALGRIQPYAPGHSIAAVVAAGRHSGELLRFWPGIVLALFYALLLCAAGAYAVAKSDVT